MMECLWHALGLSKQHAAAAAAANRACAAVGITCRALRRRFAWFCMQLVPAGVGADVCRSTFDVRIRDDAGTQCFTCAMLTIARISADCHVHAALRTGAHCSCCALCMTMAAHKQLQQQLRCHCCATAQGLLQVRKTGGSFQGRSHLHKAASSAVKANDAAGVSAQPLAPKLHKHCTAARRCQSKPAATGWRKAAQH